MTSRQRARDLIAAWDERGIDLEFVQNADGSTVHVVAPDSVIIPGFDSHPDVDAGHRTWGEILGDSVIDAALGTLTTVCGVQILRNLGGLEEGGRLTDRFDDELLCQRCHAAFGDRGVVIFECNSREQDVEEALKDVRGSR